MASLNGPMVLCALVQGAARPAGLPAPAPLRAEALPRSASAFLVPT